MRFFFKNLKFSQLNNLKLKNENIKAIIFDLGYSYVQIKDKKKGLSFDSKGDLNMKMGLNNISADDVITVESVSDASENDKQTEEGAGSQDVMDMLHDPEVEEESDVSESAESEDPELGMAELDDTVEEKTEDTPEIPENNN